MKHRTGEAWHTSLKNDNSTTTLYKRRIELNCPTQHHFFQEYRKKNALNNNIKKFIFFPFDTYSVNRKQAVIKVILLRFFNAKFQTNISRINAR